MHLSSYMPGGIRVERGSLEAERQTWLVLNLSSDMPCQGDHRHAFSTSLSLERTFLTLGVKNTDF